MAAPPSLRTLAAGYVRVARTAPLVSSSRASIPSRHALSNPAVTARRCASSLSFSWYRIAAPEPSLQPALDRAVRHVLAHDPSGYLPGRLLPSQDNRHHLLQTAYYASRSFWIETGLRHPDGGDHNADPSAEGRLRSPRSVEQMLDRLEIWQRGVDLLSLEDGGAGEGSGAHPGPRDVDSTLSLLRHVVARQPTTSGGVAVLQSHLTTILDARRTDLRVKQYETMDDLVRHCQRSCAPLLHLLLDVGGVSAATHPASHLAALHVGTAHGLSNALRTSIPVVSNTGKLVIPADLCVKHGVKSPRYLLSALGQGDEACVEALKRAVHDIATEARSYLRRARELRPELGRDEEDGGKHDPRVAALVGRVLLPGVASETFLDRLEAKDFMLTDRSLRQVGPVEHLRCALGMARAAYQGRY